MHIHVLTPRQIVTRAVTVCNGHPRQFRMPRTGFGVRSSRTQITLPRASLSFERGAGRFLAAWISRCRTPPHALLAENLRRPRKEDKRGRRRGRRAQMRRIVRYLCQVFLCAGLCNHYAAQSPLVTSYYHHLPEIDFLVRNCSNSVLDV